jgi:ABC-type multidrug transport system permease subunit
MTTMTLRNRLYWGASDIWAVTQRNLIAYTRIPEAMVFSSIQPIMFVLLFVYVFGGAVSTPGFRYVDFIMPGIFVQTVCFGAVSTGIGLADDLGKGLIERFRSLPMARSAVLAGRTTADLCRNVFVVLLMTVVGVAVGFRSSTGFFSFMAGVFILLAFAYALSWLFAVIGLVARNAETAQAMAFPLLFPLAAGVRRAPAGDRRGRRLPEPHGRRSRIAARGVAVDGRDAGRARSARGQEVPQSRVASWPHAGDVGR